MSKSPANDPSPAASNEASNGQHSSAESAEEYKVGNGKPPLHSQFKPNNKFGKGRKAGSKGLKTIVNEAMAQKVPVKVGGKEKKLSKIELAIHQVVTKASQGDLKAADKTVALFERYGLQNDTDAPEPEKLRTDYKTLKSFLAMKDLLDPEDEGEGKDV